MALSWRDFLPTDLGSGTDFSTGQRNVNLNQEFIKNTAYDQLKGGVQYEDAPEGLVWDANRNQYVKKGAPTGPWGGLMSAADWLIPGQGTDFDRAASKIGFRISYYSNSNSWDGILDFWNF